MARRLYHKNALPSVPVGNLSRVCISRRGVLFNCDYVELFSTIKTTFVGEELSNWRRLSKREEYIRI
jgi:hypothetical protein